MQLYGSFGEVWYRQAVMKLGSGVDMGNPLLEFEIFKLSLFPNVHKR